MTLDTAHLVRVLRRQLHRTLTAEERQELEERRRHWDRRLLATVRVEKRVQIPDSELSPD